MGANVAPDAIAKDALTCQLPQILVIAMPHAHILQEQSCDEESAPCAHVNHREQSCDEESENESDYSTDSDTSSTISEIYETETVTDNFYNHEDSDTDL
jgi:hypothetical protein